VDVRALGVDARASLGRAVHLARPAAYEEAISGGYCFAMAGVWLAIRALADRRASLTRLALMSLCVGLAAGSRPTLALTAVVLVPVYLSLRAFHPRRQLLAALTIPFAACVLLLLAYNQARFGSLLEVGTNYQLNGVPPNVTHLDDLSYLAPGLWFYGVNAPRITALFPFIVLTPPPTAYPGSLPGLYRVVEPTGGLLTMAPIVVFLAALPWIRRRRSGSLGRLACPFLLLAGAGSACALFLAYTFYAATERYEVDFTTLLLLGALAAWLALSSGARRRRRRLARIGGGLLASWSCVAGLAISFTGYYNLLATTHRGIWKTLQDIGSPISRTIAVVEGRPVLAEVTGVETPEVFAGKNKELVIVSPDTRTAGLEVDWVPAVKRGAELVSPSDGSTVRIRGPGNAASVHRIRSGGEVLRIPVHLSPGVNRVTITPLPIRPSPAGPAIPISAQLLYVESLWLEDG
jgi:hypothetical protein